jgi:ubiquinone/menaquinone biosynthesis C-methylase UbiE
MNRSEEKLSQGAKPMGFWGRIIARIRAIAHRAIYKNVASVLNLQPEDDYLEIGFGSGSFMKSYASHVQNIAGLDYSEDMVRLATRYNRKRIKACTAEFKQGEVSSLPWGDGRFTVVLSMDSFFFFLKPIESLKEIHRVLRPGGRLVIGLSLHAKDHTKDVKKYGIRLDTGKGMQAMFQVRDGEIYINTYIQYTGKEMQAMFQEAGFRESSVTYSKGFMMPMFMVASAIK